MLKPTFLEKKLLFIVAHPDDESFLAAGTAIKNREAGGKNYILCATYGEQGKSHLKVPMTTRQLGLVRKNEMLQVAKYLKVDGLHFLGLPDTKVKDNKLKFFQKADVFLRKIKPDFVIGFGKDGISGHIDHIAAGDVARRLAKKYSIPYLAFGASPAFVRNFALTSKRRAHGKYGKNIKHPKPNLKVQINYAKKLKAFKFHKSQFGSKTLLQDFPKQVRDNFMAYEYFVK